MKKYIAALGLAAATVLSFTSCSEDELDRNSIFEQGTVTANQNDFDIWLKQNFTEPYNIRVLYRMEDMETDLEHTAAPADFILSQKLAKIVKYAWLEAYDEVAGVDFTRQYVPKVLHFIGSALYEDNGTMILGTAEGGLKVTLNMVNDLQIDREFLNTYYFRTMHHEFTHILNQTKNYDTDYERISEGQYVAGDWYLQSDTEARQQGFIRNYSMSSPDEDYADMLSMYVCHTPEEWAGLMREAGPKGAEIITRKLGMIKIYMDTQWNIDLDKLRDAVNRRMGDVCDGTLNLSPICTLD
ncbi:MAG: putative zinc-binding metallopeptidase [Prevotella sp.]|nr:putative zinc-binding metallopeptidase [Prevotella sp.]